MSKPDLDRARIALACLLGAVLLVLLLSGAVTTGGSSSDVVAAEGGEAAVLSEFELRQRAYTLEHSLYWLGRRPGVDRYQLETRPDGSAYVRYLPAGSNDGESGGGLLTVGTYPVEDAATALRQAAAASGRAVVQHEGFLTLAPPESDSAHLVFEADPELQMEIYSPSSGEAAALAEAGALIRVH